ncbi:MAG: TonB-dependent receptor plug domain-containing protein, partial [Rhodothermales bacterium]|nr:TonB-dependent receptor plug domain-containing protein [Rhodothermales bacterium]
VLAFVMLVLTAPSALGQSGKIAGRVTDAASGEPLPGVNVVIVGTLQGTSSDLDGYYTILNVKPGTYAVQASFVGFARQTFDGVRVNIDLTTTINYSLEEEAFGLEEVTITASRPVVQPDISSSQANISASEVEALPANSVASVVGLQAGVQGLSVRGSGTSELLFNLNGLTLRDERDNSPFTNISLASIDEIQLLTGGFNAEYGQVRSGVLNVVTKEGRRDRFSGDAIIRYSAPAQKHFGANANDFNSYWIRPLIDSDVAFDGTQSGAWDRYTQDQYRNWDGWIAETDELLSDGDPSNDLTPSALQRAFTWQYRKDLQIAEPDYQVDVGFGGPIVKSTRFYASYRRDQEMYMIPLFTDRFEQQTFHAKVTTDLKPGMKLAVEGLFGQTEGTASSRSGQPGVFRSASGIASQLSRISFINTRIFSTDYWTPYQEKFNLVGATFTHAINDKSFYEVRMARSQSKYDANPGRLRDASPVVTFGGIGFDEAPFGFQPAPTFGVDGMRTGVGMSNSRDSTFIANYNLRGDITSQMNRVLQVKTGIEFNVTDSEVNYGRVDAFLPSSDEQSKWDETPIRGAAYTQGKLEFRGMVANLGLRLDFFTAGTDWYTYDPFTPAFSARLSAGLDTLVTRESSDAIFTLSPRLGVSFPITTSSKLFFNYGHFRKLPTSDNLYLLRFASSTGQITRIANPNNPLERTIAYEIGFEQSLFGQYLLRLAGYYKDVSLQPYLVEYTSRDGQTSYFQSEPNSFEDIRGFEVTLSRNRGRWVQGFVNYTYMVFTSGYFGFRRIQENTTAQRIFENDDTERRRASSRPVPQPYARANLDVLVPSEYGRLLGDWRVSFIGRWQAGSKYTWTGGGSVPGVIN